MDYSVLIWSVCLYIESHLQEADLPRVLARQTSFSLPHLRDVFSAHTGSSLSSYILQRRLANAARLLLDTDLDVLAVALRFGFSSRDVFARALRRHTGYSPSALRKNRPSLPSVRLWAGVCGPGLPILNQEV